MEEFKNKDFDPVVTPAQKLLEVKNVKSLWKAKKLMKELWQTVIIDKENKELIGSLQLHLKNIPATGQLDWFNLKKKSKIHTYGAIQLQMFFGLEKIERVPLEEHHYLVRIILLNLVKQEFFNPSTWDGKFDPKGELVLRQHLVQSNLSFMEDHLIRFVEYVNLHQSKPLNFDVLAHALNNLITALKDNLLEESEFMLLSITVKKLLPSCFNYIRKIRKFAGDDRYAIKQLDGVLSIIQDLTGCFISPDADLISPAMYNWLATTIHEFHIPSTLRETVLRGAYDRFKHLANYSKFGNLDTTKAMIKYFLKVTHLVTADLQKAKDHHDVIFKERMNFPYAKTLFTVYQSSICEMMEYPISNVCKRMKAVNLKKKHRNATKKNPSAIDTVMFKLYQSLQSINKTSAQLFLDDDQLLQTFRLRKFYNWFSLWVERCLDIHANQALQRIERAVMLDTFIPVTSTVQISSSAIDIITIFDVVIKFVDELKWPDTENLNAFITKIIKDISKGSVHYANHVVAKVDGVEKIHTEHEMKFKFADEWCTAMNNVDYIHSNIRPFVQKAIIGKMLLDDSLKNEITIENCRKTFEEITVNAVINIGNKKAELREKLVEEMEPFMTKFLREGAELLHQQYFALDHLIEFLDENLIAFKLKLSPDTFNSIHKLIWEKLVIILSNMAQDGIKKERPPSYFSNLHETLEILIGFLKIDEIRMHDENSEQNDKISRMEQILTIYGMETSALIHQYHLERLKEQNQIEKSEEGLLTVTLEIDSDKLHVDILHGQKIKAMDNNGFSDPFVSVRLLPEEKFPDTKCTTKVQKRTLFPLFDEKFFIPISAEQRVIPDILIMFVMKDDNLSGMIHEYMAEAYIRLSDVSPAEPNLLPKRTHLKLNRPFNLESDVLKALENRRNDKLATNFANKQKKRMKIS